MGKGEKSKWELATCCQSVWRRDKWHNGVNEAVPGSLQGGMMMESKRVFTVQNARKFGNLETAWTAKGQRRTSRLKTQELIESLIQNIRPQTPPTPTSCCQETAPLPFSMGLEVQIQALRMPVWAEWRSEASGWNKRHLVKVYRLSSETLQAAPSPCSLTCFQIFSSREYSILFSLPPTHIQITRFFFGEMELLKGKWLQILTPWPCSVSTVENPVCL